LISLFSFKIYVN